MEEFCWWFLSLNAIGIDDVSQTAPSGGRSLDTDSETLCTSTSTVVCGGVHGDSWTPENCDDMLSSLSTAVSASVSTPTASQQNTDVEMLYQRLQMLQLRLDEATKTLQVERELV